MLNVSKSNLRNRRDVYDRFKECSQFLNQCLKSNFAYGVSFALYYEFTLKTALDLLHDLGYLPDAVFYHAIPLRITSVDSDFVDVILGDYGRVTFGRFMNLDQALKDLYCIFDLHI